MTKKWQIALKVNQEIIDKFPEINEVVLQLLYNRGLKTQDEIDVFLGPDYNRDQYDPFLFREMTKAVEAIRKAIENKQKIFIYGDYDADGLSSAAVLYLTLQKIGAKGVGVYIPDRLNEGYGMNRGAVEKIAADGAKLIITVDCGISGVEEVKLAKSKGVKVVVTDHHLPGVKLPKPDALICPTVEGETYPFKELAGVGVAFKLAQALLRHSGGNEAFEKWLLDLVAIGTVADMVPLLGENRTLAKWGLLVLNKTQRLGLQELIESANIKTALGTYHISFQLAPRLNAAGRMDRANSAFDLLVSDDEAEAMAIANELDQKNTERQKITEEIMKASLEQIGQPKDGEKILFSADDGWSAGLVGLAAGKLCDIFHRPVIVFGKMGQQYIGSGRSIAEMNIVESLEECGEYLAEFGGHRQACGLTIVGENNFEEFKKKMKKVAKKKLQGVEPKARLEIEAEIDIDQANWGLVDALDKFEPFGQGNREPIFLTRNLEICDIVTMGKANQHLKLLLKNNHGQPKKFVGFNLVDKWQDKIKSGDKIDVVYRLNVNEWNGNREIEFKIEDLRVVGIK